MASTASAPGLTSICSSDIFQNALQPYTGITFGDVTASPVYNVSVATSDTYPGIDGRNFCNVTVGYYHDGKSDNVNVWYYFPEAAQYQGRFLATGGGGFAINSGSSGLEAGLYYGAASGCTDGGFGWGNEFQDVVLASNGSLNYDMIYNFGYLSIHEMTVIGKGLAENVYNSSKLYSYYQGCSEGGREGWSQMQRYANTIDGAAIGAPAFRQAFQQVQHDWPQVYEFSNLNGYAPSTCALAKTVNETITACDALDGKTDGIVARSDLCRLHYNATSAIGKPYTCSASSSANPITGALTAVQAANGTITANDIAVFLAVQDGPYDNQNRHLYVGYQPGTDTSSNAAGTYNTTTGIYDVAAISGIGAKWITYLLHEVASESLSLEGVDVDTLRAWIIEGQQKYSGTLNTVWTDLSELESAGGKVIHYHGEADNSIPTLSSVIYWEQVRRTLYPTLAFAESVEKMNEFYRLYLVPGAGHCHQSTEGGSWPLTALGSVIEWVENDVVPTRLNSTVVAGDEEGEVRRLCSFPYRPMWQGNGTAEFECVMAEQEALDTWFPVLDSIPINAYGDGGK
ncbi:putative tannase/feruloyl esterase, alpha/Beta hydrolase [Septoria linicola]|nr:putative tannase/feruloyl esterase, alpha/Beta hydrolase [Septoria linicola]